MSQQECTTYQAQRTQYKGVWYRSKLEAKVAQALDNLGIAFTYEPQGYKLSNGMWYRPDFWLPYAKQFIECKGKMDEIDAAKIVGLVNDHGMPVVVLGYGSVMLVTRMFDAPELDVVTYSSGIQLVRCAECGKQWFMSTSDTYACRCCGAYNGDAHLSETVDIESGQELFMHGQKVAAGDPFYRQIAESFNN